MNPVVAAIADENHVVLADSDPPGPVKLAVSGPGNAGRDLGVGAEVDHPHSLALGRGAGLEAVGPTADEFTVRVEHIDAVQPFVGDVQVTLGIEIKGGRPDHLARAIAIRPELVNVLFVQGCLADAKPVAPELVAAVQHVDHVVVGDRHVYGVAEPGARELIAPHGMAVGEGTFG